LLASSRWPLGWNGIETWWAAAGSEVKSLSLMGPIRDGLFALLAF